MAVLFADAAFDCSKLVYAGALESIELTGERTEYVVNDLRAIRNHSTQELRLKSTGKTIAPGYLRPYALVHTPKFLPRSRQSAELALFSFGYWGCGTATKQVVAAIDAAEQARGFAPPLWVDTRIRRSVRAIGFRDDAFKQLLGKRYVWMRDLGNANVAEGLPGIRIARPQAVRELLDLATIDRGRRVIFFCSCEHPQGCHRREIAKLAVREARALGFAIVIDDWPGGEPGTRELEVSAATIRKVRAGSKRLSLPGGVTLADAASIPWGTFVTLRAGAAELQTALGPARFDAAGGYLPVLGVSTPRERDAWRRENGYVPLRSW